MRRSISFLLVLLLLGGGLYFTNPDKDDFKEFIARAMNERKDELPEEFNEVLAGFGMEFSNLAGVLARLTHRKEFYLFSLYEIDYMDQRYLFLGIATQFIPLEVPKEMDVQ